MVGITRKPLWANEFIVSDFRAYPLDLDMFMHLNNTAYPRVAELASWELVGAIGFYKLFSQQIMTLVIVEQNVSYLRQIKPFQRYEVRTTINSVENKWLDYTHFFMQHREDVPSGNDPVVYATIKKRGVVKSLKGKTIPVEEYQQYLHNFRNR